MKIKLSLLVLLVVISSMYLGWREWRKDRSFECRARINSKLDANGCNKTSAIDTFLALHGNGKGYMVLSGSYSCPNTELKTIDSTIDFTYQKAGGYYSLHLGPRSPEVIKLVGSLKNDEVKFKLTEMANGDYIITTPIQTVLMCTTEE
ncbi:TPA: hypothetical protein ACKP1B_002828 [Serratia fonticola]